jgi:hypothetical protein
MVRSKFAALAFATLIASLYACASDTEASSSPGKSGQTPAPTTTMVDDQPPNAAVSDKPSPTVSDKPASTSGETPTPGDETVPTPTSGETPTAATDFIDPTGVWWTEVMTIGSEVLPILDNLTGTNIRFVMRVEVSGEPPNNQVKFDFCQLQTEWIDPADPNNITTIGFRPDTVAAFSETTTVDLGGLPAGSKVPLPSLKFIGGTDESGKEFDEDGDGNPAVTAWVRTLLGIEIEVYETITISATLDLTAPDENTLSGTVDFSADALIVTSNNVIIGAGTRVTITPDSKQVPLSVKRLPNGGDCSSLPSTLTFTTVPPPPPVLIPPPETEPTPAP